MLQGRRFDTEITEKREQEIPEKMKQKGWNCFDVAINAELSKRPELQKQFDREVCTKYVLEHIEEYRGLLAPEIKHAAALAAVHMNLLDDSSADERKAKQLVELFALAEELAQEGFDVRGFLESQANQLLEQNSRGDGELSAFALPETMRTEALCKLFNDYADAHEAMRECVETCNKQIGRVEGDYWSIAELDAFFKKEANQSKHMMAYFGYKGMRDKLFTPAETAFLDYCCSEATCKRYIEEYYNQQGWFAFQAHPKERSTSMIDIVARRLQVDIEIYHQDSRELLYTTDIGEMRISSTPLEITFNGRDHFVSGKSVLNPSNGSQPQLHQEDDSAPPPSSSESTQEKPVGTSFEYIAGSRGKTDTSVKVTDSTFGKKENRKAIDKHNEQVATRVRQDTTEAVKQLDESKQPASSSVLSNPSLVENFAALTNKIGANKVTLVDGNQVENKHKLTFTSSDASSSLKNQPDSQGDLLSMQTENQLDIQQLQQLIEKNNQQNSSTSIKEAVFLVNGNYYKIIHHHERAKHHRSEQFKPLKYGVPKPISDTLVPRDNLLSKLAELLSQVDVTQTDDLKIIAMYAPGGMGKTQLAIQFANETYKQELYQAIIWLEANGNTVLENACENLACELLGEQARQLKPEHRVASINRELSRRYHSVLFVFDNVDSDVAYNAVRSYLERLPDIETVHVLITTRNEQMPKKDMRIEGFFVNKFIGEESLTYIKLNLLYDARWKKESIDDQQALVKAVDAHPLSLFYLVSYIRQMEYTISECLKYYDSCQCENSDLLQEMVEHVNPGQGTAMLLSLKQIEEQSPLAYQVLEICGYLAADNISRSLIVAYFKSIGVSVNKQDLTNALVVLTEYSLVNTTQKELGYYHVHRLLQKIVWLRHQSKKASTAEYAWYYTTYPVYRLLQVMIFSNWEIAPPLGHIGMTVNQLLVFFGFRLRESGPKLISAEIDVAIKENIKQEHIHAENVCQRIGEVALSLPIKIQKKYVNLLLVIGNCFDETARYTQAIYYYQQALTACQKSYGSDSHPEVVLCLIRLGNVLRAVGSYFEAKKCLQKALDLCQDIYNTDIHFDVASCFFNIGNVFCNEGDYFHAEKNLEKALSIYRQIHGADDIYIDVAACFNSLGIVFRTKGDYSKAGEYLEKALNIYRKTDNQPDVALCLLRLGEIFRREGNYPRAKKYLQDSLELYQKIYHDNLHPYVAGCLNGLGNVFRDEGDYPRAKKYFQDVLELYQKIYCTNIHPHVAVALNNLGTVFLEEEEKDYPKAIEYLRKALSIYQQVHSTDIHPDIALYLLSIGIAFSLEFCDKQVMMHHQDVLALYKDILDGYSHCSDVIFCIMHLGIVMNSQGACEKQKVIGDCQYTLELYKQLYGRENQPGIARSIFKIGLMFKEQGLYDEAKRHLQKALDIFKHVHKSDTHTDIKVALEALESLDVLILARKVSDSPTSKKVIIDEGQTNDGQVSPSGSDADNMSRLGEFAAIPGVANQLSEEAVNKTPATSTLEPS